MSVIIKEQENIIQDTKKHIIEIARQLFSESSYLGVSMNDIAKKLNITKAALYYHFKNKEDLHLKVLDQVVFDWSASIKKTKKEVETDSEKLHRIIKNYLDFGFKEKGLIKVLVMQLPSENKLAVERIFQAKEEVSRLIQKEIETMFAEERLIGRMDSQLSTTLLTSMMNGLILDYSFLDKPVDSAKVSDQIVEALFKK